MATTRKQMFLQKINDSNFSTPVPVTVEEQILDGMSGGGGVIEFYDVTITQYAVIVHGLTYRDVRQKMNDGKVIILRGVDTKEADSVHLYVLVQFLVSGDPKLYNVHGITYNGSISFTSENLDDELQLYIGG